MKRKPLKRKTELKAKKQLTAKTELKATKGLTTTTRLKFRSKKMEAIYVDRRILVQRLLKERPTCGINWDGGCTKKSTDVHERLARSVGGKIVGDSDDAYITCCRYCHTMVTDNPGEAHRRGFVIRSWE